MEESVIKSRYPNLRRKGRKAIGKEWGELNLKDGFEYFFELHGKYPTAKDVDRFDYLPSCRTMQRSFGGIMELRKILSLNCQTNFTTGEMRSKLCREGDFRAQKFEKEFFEYLVSHIPEQRVHEHKIIRPGNTAADFFIYTSENSGIVIDIFYAMDLHSLVGQIDIKAKKYKDVIYPVYFVLVGNSEIKQDDITMKINNKRNGFPKHIQVMTENNFKRHLTTLL